MKTCLCCLRTFRRAFFEGRTCEYCNPLALCHPPAPDDSMIPDPAWSPWLAERLLAPEEHCTDDECGAVLAARRGWVTQEEYTLIALLFTQWKLANPSTLPTGQWLGELKQRLDITGCRCESIQALGVNPEHPEWGARFVIKFTSASGHALTWFASEGGTFDPKVGGTYNIRCTVQKHDEWEGKRATVVNRCREL